jgi:hypothetical protein
MSHRRAALYLQIPAAYCRIFGGMRWAQYGEAVEFLDGPDAGRTFAFAAEIGQFLEGLLGRDDWCPAFGTVLHLLCMLGLGDRATAAGRGASFPKERLARPFRELRNPVRNAGALCAWLCRDVPGVADPPVPAEVIELLNGGSWIPQMVMSHPMLGAMDYAEQPAADATTLDDLVSARLDELSDEAIRHWLRFARGPLGGVEDIDVTLPTGGPVDTLAQVEERPRLAGLTRLVRRLEGAISLPPRRLEQEGPQVDGYSDLATRGSPEQILPIQFALDDDEFLRRFAEHELLYYQRERPNRPVAQELVLLLDQGVRTWGDVRLLLAAATMAMARQAGRRKLAVRLATTGGGDLVDVAELSPAALGQLLESSDLSPNPARTLARILRDDSGRLRDVVLLTHPRSLPEPDVIEATREAGGNEATRIFSVSADDGGDLELAELRHGRPVGLSRCRVDVSDAAAPPPAPPPRTRRGRGGPRLAWRGDVEPIPFPFRCWLLGSFGDTDGQFARLVDFDESAGWILIAMRHGLFCACQVDGSDAEVLPRALVKGEVLMRGEGVIGVSGGFVVVGRRESIPVLAHYDFTTRTCAVHALPTFARGVGPVSWSYHADLHCLAGRPLDRGRPCMAVDLSAGGEAALGTPRAASAAERARAGIPPYPSRGVEPETSASEPWFDRTCRDVELDPGTGTLRYRPGCGEPRSLTPMSDGHPALKGGRIASMQQGGDVLALEIEARSVLDLWFLSISRSAVLGRFSYESDTPAKGWFALSRDGRRFARRVGQHRVEVRDVPGDRAPVMIANRERSWSHFASLGPSCLLVHEFDQVGARRPHAQALIEWGGGRLIVDRDDPAQNFQRLGGVVAESRSLPYGSTLSPAVRGRFGRFIEHGRLRILIDEYNHLAVLGPGERLVAMFYLSGREFGAWLPDGTSLGSSWLIGGPPPKDAADRIGAALRAAERGEGGPP